jgi:crotonobetainyl-CoA:carnitine CoA-transferase CaiB-like acyl-CoA transferase
MVWPDPGGSRRRRGQGGAAGPRRRYPRLGATVPQGQSGAETREAGYYLCVNRGKRSITIELDKPEGQRVVRALAARSDIVLENFKVGTLKRFGLGYDDLKAVNPD